MAEAERRDHQEQDRAAEGQVGEAAVAVVVDARDGEHRDDADDREHSLTREEVKGVVVALRGEDRAGAEHHHDAEGDEGDDGRGQDRVGGPDHFRIGRAALSSEDGVT